MYSHTFDHQSYSMESSSFLKKFQKVSAFCDPGTYLQHQKKKLLLQIKTTKCIYICETDSF